MTSTESFPPISPTDLATIAGGSDPETPKAGCALRELASTPEGRQLLARYLPSPGTKGHP